MPLNVRGTADAHATSRLRLYCVRTRVRVNLRRAEAANPASGRGRAHGRAARWNDAHTLTRPPGSLAQCRRRLHGRADRTALHLGRRFRSSGVYTPALCAKRVDLHPYG
jgi:hypothetical protein